MASLARRNPDSNTMLIALTAAGAVAFFAYAASQKKVKKSLSNKQESDVALSVNEASGGTLAEIKSKAIAGKIDFSDVFAMLNLLAVAIGATLAATGVASWIGALVAFCIKAFSGFVADACNYIVELFQKSGAATAIPVKYLSDFTKYLNENIGDLATRSTISYIGHLNIHGGTVAQGVIYTLFEAPLGLSVLLSAGVGGLIRGGLYAFEKANGLVHVTDAGDGARLAAPQMFFAAANAAKMPKALCYLMLAKLAIAAEAGVYVPMYMKEVATALPNFLFTSKTTIGELEKAALAKFGNK